LTPLPWLEELVRDKRSSLIGLSRQRRKAYKRWRTWSLKVLRARTWTAEISVRTWRNYFSFSIESKISEWANLSLPNQYRKH